MRNLEGREWRVFCPSCNKKKEGNNWIETPPGEEEEFVRLGRFSREECPECKNKSGK